MDLSYQQKIRLLFVTLLFVIGVILAQWFNLKPLLQFDRSLINQGEIWRIFTGNFIHYNFQHLWMNLAGLILGMYLLAFRYPLLHWFIIISFSSLAVGLGLYFLDPKIQVYIGLSGALHGMLVVGALSEINYNKTTGLLLVLFIFSKIAYEQIIGSISAPLSDTTTVAVNSHLYGSFAGIVIWAILSCKLFRDRYE